MVFVLMVLGLFAVGNALHASLDSFLSDFDVIWGIGKYGSDVVGYDETIANAK